MTEGGLRGQESLQNKAQGARRRRQRGCPDAPSTRDEAPTSEPEGGSGRSQTEQTPWLPAEALTQLLLLSRPPAGLLSHVAGSGPPFSSDLRIHRGPCGLVRLFRKPCVRPTSLSLSSRHLIKTYQSAKDGRTEAATGKQR